MQENTADLIWGCKAIAQEINRTERQTYHMLEKGVLPADKVGKIWVARRSRLQIVGVGEAA